jgi:hypothetical protein
MDGEREPDALKRDSGLTGGSSGGTRLRGRDGLRSIVVLVIILAAVACLFLVGRFGG